MSSRLVRWSRLGTGLAHGGKTTMPLIPATLAGLCLTRARRAGVEAVIFAWRGISTANAKGQYLPFTLPYQNIPAVFVAGDEADFVLAARFTRRPGNADR